MIPFYTSLLSQPATVDGSLRTLCSQIASIDSLVLTPGQRLFASGRDGVFELLASADGSSRTERVAFAVDGVPADCMKNGMATDGDYLYIACAHLHQSDNPLVRTILSDLNDVEQVAKCLLQLYMAAFSFRVESWILRCDLRRTPLAFTERLASLPPDPRSGGLASNFLANGMAIDPRHSCLYVANSAPGLAAAIYRVATDVAADSARCTLWHRPPGCKPNGLKLLEQGLCYTGNGASSAVLGRVPLNADGSASASDCSRAPCASFRAPDERSAWCDTPACADLAQSRSAMPKARCSARARCSWRTETMAGSWLSGRRSPGDSGCAVRAPMPARRIRQRTRRRRGERRAPAFMPQSLTPATAPLPFR